MQGARYPSTCDTSSRASTRPTWRTCATEKASVGRKEGSCTIYRIARFDTCRSLALLFPLSHVITTQRVPIPLSHVSAPCPPLANRWDAMHRRENRQCTYREYSSEPSDAFAFVFVFQVTDKIVSRAAAAAAAAAASSLILSSPWYSSV